MTRAFVVFAFVAGALSARADQDETAGLVEESCRICHARELVDSQRLSAPQWRAEVEKMVRWGAPLAPDEVAPVAAYLAETLGPNLPVQPPPTIAVSTALAVTTSAPASSRADPRGSTRRGATFYRADCATCHGDPPLGEKGPELVFRPVLDRPEEFWQVVLEGRHRMPSFAGAVPRGQLSDIYAYLKSLREPPPPPARPSQHHG